MNSMVRINNREQVPLKRSARRKTIGIKVHQGEVTVSAPVAASLQEIQHFVNQKANWIARHLQRQNTALHEQKKLSYCPDELLHVMGARYPISWDSNLPMGITGKNFNIPLLHNNAQTRALAVADWFTELARAELASRVVTWSKILGVNAKAIKIRHYKSRWGSCNRKGELQFNWLIMMAPEYIIDYIVIHELAHLKHFNHSPAFWRLVESACPNYQACRVWLRQQTHLIWHFT